MKRLVVLLMLPSLFFLSSCADYREINDTAMVSGIAVDRGKQEGTYALSVEVIQPSPSETESPKAKVLTQEGENAEACLTRLVNAATKELLFSHCKLILFSEDVARDGISQLVDYFLRSPEYRADLFLAVVSGSSAKDMLSVGEKESRVCAFDFAAVIRNSYTETGSVPPTRLYQFPADAPLSMLPMFRKEHDVYSVCGTSCLREGKQYANPDLSRTKTILLATGQCRAGELVLTGTGGDAISCRISGAKSKRTVSDDLTLSLELECNLLLTVLPEGFDLSTERGVSDCEAALGRLLSDRIYGDWLSLHAEGLDDVFGFSVYASRYAPEVYERLADTGKSLILQRPTCTVSLKNLSYSDGGVAQ